MNASTYTHASSLGYPALPYATVTYPRAYVRWLSRRRSCPSLNFRRGHPPASPATAPCSRVLPTYFLLHLQEKTIHGFIGNRCLPPRASWLFQLNEGVCPRLPSLMSHTHPFTEIAACLGAPSAHTSRRRPPNENHHLPARVSYLLLQEKASSTLPLEETTMPTPSSMRGACPRLRKSPLPAATRLLFFFLQQKLYPRLSSRRAPRPRLSFVEEPRLHLHEQLLPAAAHVSCLLQPHSRLHTKTSTCLLPATVARLPSCRSRLTSYIPPLGPAQWRGPYSHLLCCFFAPVPPPPVFSGRSHLPLLRPLSLA